MQCTSFVPVYYQPRGVNGASGFSWHLSSSNSVNYGAPRGFESSVQPSTVNPYSSYDKDMLRQIIQNHEAIFRNQVQDLHRLYKRQKELMDEMRTRGVAVQHLLSQTSESMRCLSHPQSDITQTSHMPSWLLGDRLNGKLPDSTVENLHRSPNFVHGPFGGKSSCPEVEYVSSGSEERGKRILDLELSADVHRDIEAKKFNDEKSSESLDLTDNASKKVSGVHLQPASDSGNLSNLNIGKSCLIDLNEPLSSNSTGAFGVYTTRHCSGLLNCDASSDGPDSSLVIDLNSVPVSCSSEMESATENLLTIEKEAAALSDGSSDHDHTTKGLYGEDSVFLDGSFLKTRTNIDLEMSVGDGKSAGDADFNDPATYEIPDSVEPQMHPLSEDAELDIIAARALVMISSSESREVIDPEHCLNWFAEIACFTGDDLENKIAELQNDATDNAQGCDSGEVTVKRGKGCTREARRHQKRNASKKASTKPRKCSKIVSSDAMKRSMSSILKQQPGRDGMILRGWGKMRKRRGGHRRCRTGKFVFAF